MRLLISSSSGLPGLTVSISSSRSGSVTGPPLAPALIVGPAGVSLRMPSKLLESVAVSPVMNPWENCTQYDQVKSKSKSSLLPNGLLRRKASRGGELAVSLCTEHKWIGFRRRNR